MEMRMGRAVVSPCYLKASGASIERNAASTTKLPPTFLPQRHR